MNIVAALSKSMPRGHLAARAIIEMICNDYGISETKLTRRGSQSKTLYEARRRAICLMSEMNLSDSEIAEYLKRDASVIRYHRQRGKRSDGGF